VVCDALNKAREKLPGLMVSSCCFMRIVASSVPSPESTILRTALFPEPNSETMAQFGSSVGQAHHGGEGLTMYRASFST